MYTSDVDSAATHFYLSQNAGFPVSDITGNACGSTCRIKSGYSKDTPKKVMELVLVRCTDNFLDMERFREYDGVISHSGHSASDGASVHILWKSAKPSPT